MLAELAHVPAARRTLLALAEAVRKHSTPAGTLIEHAGGAPPDDTRINHVLHALAQVRQLDRRIAMLRVRASGPRSAAETVACRYESARLTDGAAAILRDLPISRTFVRALAGEMLTLQDRLERAARRLTGPGDIDRIHAVERHVGMRAETFQDRCMRLRRAGAWLAALEQHRVDTEWETSKGRELCVSERR
jgi:hypothetical protein